MSKKGTPKIMDKLIPSNIRTKNVYYILIIFDIFSKSDKKE
jgi:hypothetical protein